MSDRVQTSDIDLSINNTNTIGIEAKIAKEVASQFVAKKTGKIIKAQTLRKEVELMLRLTEEMGSKYEPILSNMINRLNLNSENAHNIFSEVVEEIFRDRVNWGRVIMVYAFGGKIAEHCKQTNNEQMIEKVGLWVGNSVAKKSSWIKESGRGWNGFMEQFRDRGCAQESSWFQGLFAATLGFGTLAAALYIKS